MHGAGSKHLRAPDVLYAGAREPGGGGGGGGGKGGNFLSQWNGMEWICLCPPP